MSMSIALPLEGLIKKQIEIGEAENSQEVEEKLKARLYQMELDRTLEKRRKLASIKNCTPVNEKTTNAMIERFKSNLKRKNG